ncbi:host attachment protein [Actibacterium sp. D379-3]
MEHAMKRKRTFVLIANEQQALFLENDGIGRGLAEVGSLRGGAKSQFSDLPGRSQATPGGTRHGFDRTTPEREHDRESFAAEVIEKAHAIWATGGYDRMVMSAPPKMLGALRDALPDPMRKALVGDMDKDLLNLALPDLPSHFEDMIAL